MQHLQTVYSAYAWMFSSLEDHFLEVVHKIYKDGLYPELGKHLHGNPRPTVPMPFLNILFIFFFEPGFCSLRRRGNFMFMMQSCNWQVLTKIVEKHLWNRIDPLLNKLQMVLVLKDLHACTGDYEYIKKNRNSLDFAGKQKMKVLCFNEQFMSKKYAVNTCALSPVRPCRSATIEGERNNRISIFLKRL